MTKEALNMALKALQFSGNIWHMDCKKNEAITAIKEALAQPEQEPVAWMYQSGDKFGWRDEIQFVQPPNHPVFRNVVALYTTPPAAQPEQERNFCPRCGKRTADLTVIHTCTPPRRTHENR
jgi:hypothetical protein